MMEAHGLIHRRHVLFDLTTFGLTSMRVIGCGCTNLGVSKESMLMHGISYSLAGIVQTKGTYHSIFILYVPGYRLPFAPAQGK